MSHLNDHLPVLVRSAVQANIIGWSSRNLSNWDLKVSTESASTVFFLINYSRC